MYEANALTSEANALTSGANAVTSGANAVTSGANAVTAQEVGLDRQRLLSNLPNGIKKRICNLKKRNPQAIPSEAGMN